MKSDLNRLTDRSRKVLDLAAEEADRYGHDYVGTEHLLLALTTVNGGVARNVLAMHGITAETLRAELEELMDWWREPQQA